MLDTPTKKRIDDCRDILVGKLPDPKAQIEQITIALIYKFMDDMDKEAIELGGKAKFFSDYFIPDPKNPGKEIKVEFRKFCWDNLFDSKVTASEMLSLYSEAIAAIDKNPNIPPLFRDIFKNAFLPYRDPETLKLFLKTIGEFEYTHSEKLGDAFEYLLSVMGSQGDAGQFRTPRHIIDFLVSVVDPKKTDNILDPACGTAGFLVSAFKHILLKDTKANNDKLNIFQYNNNFDDAKPFNNLGDQQTPDERKKVIRNFTGYDISPDMVRLSLVNLYLHGFSDPHIFEYDTLTSEDRWNETYDVILANPPFMSPKGGIRPHKKFSISSNRSEVLFVDYIAEHLNPKGRAGIIVPEGVIFQSGTAYKELRRSLVDNYLYAVVSLPAGVFNPYSGVKTSILLMDKELAKANDEILFVKIDNDGFGLGAQRNKVKGGQLEQAVDLIRSYIKTQCIAPQYETIAHAVSKTEIAKNGDYNLSGERYKIVSNHNSDFQLVSLSDESIFKVVSGGTPSSENEEFWNGEVYWATLIDLPATDYISTIFSTERKITEKGLKNSSAKLLPINSILISTRATIGRIAINKVECCTNQGFKNIIINDANKANSQFVAYMMTTLIEKMNSIATGGTFKELSASNFKTLQIPLPPISVQEVIVAEIEGYQKIIDGAKMVVENYKPQINIDPEWEMVELGNEIDFVSGLTLSIPECEYENGTPIISMKEVKEDGSLDISEIRRIRIPKKKYETLKRGDLLFNWRNGSKELVGKTAYFDLEGEFVFASFCLGIRVKERLCSKFLWILLNQYRVEGNYLAFMRQNVNGLFNREELKILTVPVPSLEIQRQIVSRIEKEQVLVNASKQLIEIFEQKIKDRIAKVWGE
jgi:type I restriction enzyme M protein